MRAFVDTRVEKQTLLDELIGHQEADQFVQGIYWDLTKIRGCAVGCTLHTFAPGQETNHVLYEPLFGIPAELARLEDEIFEVLGCDESKEWPVDFVRAIPVGADLSLATARWIRWLFSSKRSPLEPWLHFACVKATATMYERICAGSFPSDDTILRNRELALDIEKSVLSSNARAVANICYAACGPQLDINKNFFKVSLDLAANLVEDVLQLYSNINDMALRDAREATDRYATACQTAIDAERESGSDAEWATEQEAMVEAEVHSDAMMVRVTKSQEREFKVPEKMASALLAILRSSPATTEDQSHAATL